ncbi:MAG: PilT/PilU family type 4a pilus ATPase, partial [Planctomycetota bacterium]|nr:PilT/PilU family type 4a pilus ATPase [Planctomycetota bacterium]
LPRGWPGGIAPTDPSPGHIQQYLARAHQAGASDLYINSASVPALMLHGELRPFEGCPALTPEQAAVLVRQTMTREQWDYFDRHGDLCFCYAFAGGRYRASAFRHRSGCGAAFRVIRERIPALDQLGLPAGCARLAQFTEGLVLIAAPAGAGKTTTMMALADTINHARHAHILTIEEPIEYALPPAEARISQREVGSHTASVAAAIQGALREDVDVIVIGELRDELAIAAALAAAEAGHLIFATVQAPDCARAIDRIMECTTDPTQRRNAVADNLRAIIGQQLVRRKDGHGRVAACEMLFNSISVGNIIREGKTHNLVNVMQTGRQQGMIMLDDSLRALVEEGAIGGEEAYARAKNKVPFKQYLPEPPKPAPEAPKPPEPAKPPPARR